jgi:N-acetylglucosaminyl-diphospho-decaprenol L-rhamnosyltransferase
VLAASYFALFVVIRSVGIVVVNFNGSAFVGDCLEALTRTTWHGELSVVVVDNASTDGSASTLDRSGVRLLKNRMNVGFGGGCNRGFAALEHCDAVALVNSDAFVEPGWLDPLVAALDRNPALGAVVPLTLLSGSWIKRKVCSPVFIPGGADNRNLGVRVLSSAGAHIVSLDLHDQEAGFRWTSRQEATLFVARETASLAVVCPNGAEVEGTSLRPSESVQTVHLGQAPSIDLIDNVGTSMTSDWWTHEISHMRVRQESALEAGPIELWSGGAVLLRRAFLDDVGFFDEPMFLYYEDTELALRGRRLGWRYSIEPKSVVRHGHGWSTGGSANPLVRYCTERNRLVVIARHAPLPTVAMQWGRHVAAIARATRHRDRAETNLLARALAGAVRSVIRGPQPKWKKAKRPGRFHPGRPEIESD